jgi:hypothetical protein
VPNYLDDVKDADNDPDLTLSLHFLLGGRRSGERDLEDGARLLLADRGVYVELDPDLWPLPPELGCRDD